MGRSAREVVLDHFDPLALVGDAAVEEEGGGYEGDDDAGAHDYSQHDVVVFVGFVVVVVFLSSVVVAVDVVFVFVEKLVEIRL